MARFCPLFSGSSGNSMYFASGGRGFLVDVGMSAKKMETALSAIEVEPGSLSGVFITHEHIDHVRGLRVFVSRYHLKVFATRGTLEALEEQGQIAPGMDIRPVFSGGVELDGMEVVPFRTSHDCRESCGYIIHMADGRRAAVATDLGKVDETVRGAIRGCDLVVLESNHDVKMLQNGRYPYPTKRSILSDTGHLSNENCSAELPELVRSGATRLVLAHLSKENNMPELAMQTSLAELTMAGMRREVDYQLFVAPRENNQRVLLF